MAAAAWAALRGVTGLRSGTAGKLLSVAAPTLAGVVVYFGMAFLLRLPETRLLADRLKQRRER
jgi:hypothetical protein